MNVLVAEGANPLVVRPTKVTAPMLDAGQLSLVVRAGAGVKTIDVPADSQRSIYVSNYPRRNSIAVTELTFGLIVARVRRIPDNVAELRAGPLEQEGIWKGTRPCTAARSGDSRVQTHRQSAKRHQPVRQDTDHAHTGRSTPRPSLGSGPRVRPPTLGESQRPRNREHDFRKPCDSHGARQS